MVPRRKSRSPRNSLSSKIMIVHTAEWWSALKKKGALPQAAAWGLRPESTNAACRAHARSRRVRVTETAGGGAQGLGDGRGVCSAGTEVQAGTRRKVWT